MANFILVGTGAWAADVQVTMLISSAAAEEAGATTSPLPNEQNPSLHVITDTSEPLPIEAVPVASLGWYFSHWTSSFTSFDIFDDKNSAVTTADLSNVGSSIEITAHFVRGRYVIARVEPLEAALAGVTIDIVGATPDKYQIPQDFGLIETLMAPGVRIYWLEPGGGQMALATPKNFAIPEIEQQTQKLILQLAQAGTTGAYAQGNEVPGWTFNNFQVDLPLPTSPGSYNSGENPTPLDAPDETCDLVVTGNFDPSGSPGNVPPRPDPDPDQEPPNKGPSGNDPPKAPPSAGDPSIPDDPGLGGLGGLGPPPGNPSGQNSSDTPNAPFADPVYGYNGEFYEEATDLTVRGRGIDFVWSRKYRSRVDLKSALGFGWDFRYNTHITESGTGFFVHDGNTRADKYDEISPGSNIRVCDYLFNELVDNGDDTFTLEFPNGEEHHFHGFSATNVAAGIHGKLSQINDRFDNTLTFAYDASGRLETITDTLDRDYTLAYDSNDRITSLTDFTNRVVTYEYYDGIESGGEDGDLKSVTTPVVSGSFPNGKTTTYTYTEDATHADLEHNLLTITDGKGQLYLTNVYGQSFSNLQQFDRVITQIYGIQENGAELGDRIDIVYIDLTQPDDYGYAVKRTIVNDRVGNVRELFFNARNELVEEWELTDRAPDPAAPTTDVVNRPDWINRLRPKDPAAFQTDYAWNDDSMLTRIDRPNGNSTEYTYETTGSVKNHGNILEVEHDPGFLGGAQALIEQSFTYLTDFGCGACGSNFVLTATDGNSDTTTYQYDASQNVINIKHPIIGIEEDFEWNQFGQVTAHVLADNGSSHRRRDEFTYYTTGPLRGYLERSVVDVGGEALTTTYEYNNVGVLTKITDPKGEVVEFVVNELDQVEVVKTRTYDGTKRYERRFAYDANDNLVEVKTLDPTVSSDEQRVVFEHDILNYVTKKIEYPVGGGATEIVTEYVYDRNRNLVEVKYGEATNTNQPNNTLTIEYDERNLPYQVTQADGNASLRSTDQYDYDLNGNIERIHEGSNVVSSPYHVWNYFHDGYDRLVRVEDPMGNQVSISYDADHNVTNRRIDGELEDLPYDYNNVRLHEIDYVYDALDRLTQRDEAFFHSVTGANIGDGFSTTSYTYSDNSQIVSITNDNANEYTFLYDTANRLEMVTDPKANSIEYAYDDNSNVLSITELEKSDLDSPNSDQTIITSFVYDNLDRLVQVQDNVGNVFEYAYDSRHNRTQFIDALGNVTDYVYDGLNRLLEVERHLTDDGTGSGQSAGSILMAQEWDDTSRLVAQIDDKGNRTEYSYDDLNRLAQTLYADGETESFTYDRFDNLTVYIDQNGSTRSNAVFDFLDRPVEWDWFSGFQVDDPGDETFAYDGLSRLVSAEDGDSKVERVFNSLSNVISETITHLHDNNESGTIVNVYDGVGNKTKSTYPGGRVIDAAYDDLERLLTLKEGAATLATYHYIGRNRVEGRDNGNGTRERIDYDGVKRITGTTHSVTSSGSIIDARSYAWDGNYNKTQRKELDPVNPTGNPALIVQDFDYDSIYRMVESKKTPLGQSAQTVDYAFDDVGNRTSVSGAMLGNGSYSLSDTNNSKMNEYTSTPFDGPGKLVHDDNGNYKERDELAPTNADFFASKKKNFYDVYNQLTEVEVDAGGPWKVLAGNWILGEFTTAEGDYYHMSTGGAAPRIAKEKPNNINDIKLSFKVNQNPPPNFDPEYYATVILRAATPPASGNQYLTVSVTPEGLYATQWNNGVIEQVDTLTTTGAYLEPGVEYRLQIQATSAATVRLKDWRTASEAEPGFELTLNGIFGSSQSSINMFDWIAVGANTDGAVEFTDLVLNSTVNNPFVPVSQTYRYDPFGRRIERTTDDGLGNVETTRYFYDGWRVVEEQNASQATQATYVYGRYIDEVITMERGSEEFYYHCDDLYNIVALTDDTGTVIETYAYDDYGQPHITDATGMSVMKSSVGNPYLFNGRRYDPETGYYYYRTRYLDPHTGRFISRDTIGIWGDANNLGNGYAYVGNNPWTLLDPFGLEWWNPITWDVPGPYGSPDPAEWADSPFNPFQWNNIMDGPQDGTAWGTAQNACIVIAITAVTSAIAIDIAAPSLGATPVGEIVGDIISSDSDGDTGQSPTAPQVDYSRPSHYRKGVRDEVWEQAKDEDGCVRDPRTGEIIDKDDNWVMGHKPGYEFWKHKRSAKERGISRDEFITEHNDPTQYRPETPETSRSHDLEDNSDRYWGPPRK